MLTLYSPPKLNTTTDDTYDETKGDKARFVVGLLVGSFCAFLLVCVALSNFLEWRQEKRRHKLWNQNQTNGNHPGEEGVGLSGAAQSGCDDQGVRRDDDSTDWDHELAELPPMKPVAFV